MKLPNEGLNYYGSWYQNVCIYTVIRPRDIYDTIRGSLANG